MRTIGPRRGACTPCRGNLEIKCCYRREIAKTYACKGNTVFQCDQRLRSGFPNSDGISSSRNSSSCALAPIERPASLLTGTIASAATCQLTATYDKPGFMVATVFSPRGETKENSTRGTSWFNGSSFGSLPGVNLLVR